MDLENRLLILALRIAQMARAGDDQRQSANEEDGHTSSTSSSTVTSIAQLVDLEAKSNAYMDEGKYEEAYNLVKKQYKLGPKVNFAQVLSNYYVTLMETDRSEKAAKIKEELISLFRDHFEISAGEFENHAINLRSKKKNFEAVLFYQISGHFCRNVSDPVDAINILHRCAQRVCIITTEMLENRKVTKGLVRNQIVPDVRKIMEEVDRFEIVDKKLRCFVQGVCLHYIEQLQFQSDSLDGREATINEAIQLMRGTLGRDAEKRHIFGQHLNNLGHTYLLTNRPSEAAKVFAQAIAAKQKAEDYDTAAEKREDVQKSQLALQLARRQL